jgi:hypothetical protein
VFGRGDSLDRGYEAVAAAGEGLDKSWAGCGIAESFADAIDGGVDTVFVVDEGAVGPQLAGDLLASEELAGPVEQHQEYLEGLGVELYAETLPAKFPCGTVCLENSEAIALRWLWVGHV